MQREKRPSRIWNVDCRDHPFRSGAKKLVRPGQCVMNSFSGWIFLLQVASGGSQLQAQDQPRKGRSWKMIEKVIPVILRWFHQCPVFVGAAVQTFWAISVFSLWVSGCASGSQSHPHHPCPLLSHPITEAWTQTSSPPLEHLHHLP